MQQVFGAIGTSIATCLLSMGSGATDAEGFVAGSRYGYVFSLVLIVIVLLLNLIGRIVAKVFAVKSER